jgi:hypothetical protein
MGLILAASLTAMLALLIVGLALVGVFAPKVTTKTDAVRVLRILLNREDAGCGTDPSVEPQLDGQLVGHEHGRCPSQRCAHP